MIIIVYKMATSLVGLVLLAAILPALSVEFRTLDHIRTSTDPATQADTVTGLISRLIPSRASNFVVKVTPSLGPQFKDTFQLVTDQDKLLITGSSGVAAAWGFYYYLSQYCNCHVSWAGDQVNLPAQLPTITTPVTITSNDRFRYYQNVCTVSYSFAWYDWAHWQREIDWMAMNGINLPLAFNGQEAIWQRVYLAMGFTQEELDAHFGGPAFLAWARMGNMRGWGGPLPQAWHDTQVALQHQILGRMRDFGMTPVLPAFAGHVPDNITRLFPTANVSKLGDWNRFDSQHCCTTLLDVNDSHFVQIGKAFIQEIIKEFGTDHIYNTDTFNEMTPKSNTTEYLSSAGKAVYQAMTAGDSQAIWLMQAWLFLNTNFWKPTQAKALLTAVPQGKLILLDLFSEVVPMYNRFESYYGQPFIWCMLHNFGGTLGMYGAIESVNKGPFLGRAYPNSTMIGTGLTPEGINQNNVMYEFMNENAWRTEPRNIDKWISNYAYRRYGADNIDTAKAWILLKQSVYNCTTGYEDFAFGVIVVRQPSQDHPLNPAVWYDPEDVFQAWDHFLLASDTLADSMLFRYDLVDVTRQSLQVISIKYYNDLLKAYNNKDLDGLITSGGNLLDLLYYLETLLASDEHFLLGRWIAAAKSLAPTNNVSQLYEYNARNQVTLWGPTGNILDYANKQWSGLVSHYYSPRWKLFVEQLKQSLVQGTKFDQGQFNKDVFDQVEQPFTMDRSVFPTESQGDSVEIAKLIHAEFRPVTRQSAKFFRRLPRLAEKWGKFPSQKHFGAWSWKYERTG